jgi:N-acetyl-anhydromuramyl-L-alanine amidase AmpD
MNRARFLEIILNLFGRNRQEKEVKMNNEQRKLKVLDKFKTADEFFTDWVVKGGWSAIVMHHSATEDGRTFDSQAIRQYHIKENGWQEIGYHLLIEKVEDEWYYVLGRPLSMSGAHAGTKTSILYNKIGIGICLVGNYDIVPPEQKALGMLHDIIKKLMGYYNISRENVIGHWEVFIRLGLARTKEEAWTKYKTCPGKKFDLDAFRRTL